MQSQIDQIRARWNQAVQRARELYGMDLSRVEVLFDLKGRSSGQACMRGNRFWVRFNTDMLTREAFDHVHDNTVPHEAAHIVCFMNPQLGRGHNEGWQRVCTALGGSGARRHTEQVIFGKGGTYEYTTTTGRRVRLSEQHHRKVQAGGSRIWRNDGGVVNRDSECWLVGQSGRTLEQPVKIVRTAHGAVPACAPVAPAPVAKSYENEPLTSKAAVTRAIMREGYRKGLTYEQMIQAMQRANGYTRQLARATFKNNMARAGIPSTFC